MDRKNFETMIEMMGKLIEMRKELEGQFGSREDDKNDEDQKIADELQGDYEKFMIWCVGEDYNNLTQPESLITWNKLHPNLKTPRSLKLQLADSSMHTISLMIDAYPLYLEHKKSNP